jgi:hypothetical protein
VPSPALHKLQLDGRQVRRRLLRFKERGELESEDVCASLRNKRAAPKDHQPIVALCVDFDKKCRATAHDAVQRQQGHGDVLR